MSVFRIEQIETRGVILKYEKLRGFSLRGRKEQCFHPLSSEGVACLELYLEVILTVYYTEMLASTGLCSKGLLLTLCILRGRKSQLFENVDFGVKPVFEPWLFNLRQITYFQLIYLVTVNLSIK